MGRAHVAEMPRFLGNPGNGFLLPAVALDKALIRRQPPELSARSVFREMRPDEIDVLRFLS